MLLWKERCLLSKLGLSGAETRIKASSKYFISTRSPTNQEQRY